VKIARPIIRHAWKPLIPLLLLGCASEAPQSSGAKPFPNAPPAGYALLFVYTDRHDPLKTHPTLHIDGESVIKLRNDSYTWCYLKPGQRMVRAMWGDEDASMNHHQSFDFKGDQSVFLRISTKVTYPLSSVVGSVARVQPEVARVEIGNSLYRRPKKDTY